MGEEIWDQGEGSARREKTLDYVRRVEGWKVERCNLVFCVNAFRGQSLIPLANDSKKKKWSKGKVKDKANNAVMVDQPT
jgi:hypothetical protein